MDAGSVIQGSARAVRSLAPSLAALGECPDERAAARAAAARGHFTPDEDALVRAWFARYQTVRGSLLEVIADLAPLAEERREGVDDALRLRSFLIAYTAACMLVRAARLLVSEVATDKILQRKLNEADPEHRLPRKQYTHIHRAMTEPITAWRLGQAMRFADANRAALDALADDPELGPVLAALRQYEEALRVGVGQYLRARLRYRWHAWRRRRASAVQQGLFRVAEAFGRVVAEMRPPGHRDRVTDRHLAALRRMLRPGDVIVTRHDHALSNLFLPGYWPHAALHVGPRVDADVLGVAIDAERGRRWVEPMEVLEARKDGVLLRPLDDTFAVDAFVVLRPVLEKAAIATALANALVHEGKLYNFDFDFFTSDRLVCTEVVYRAFDGVAGISFPLRLRAGRLTLSAEDLLDMAVHERGFKALAVFGSPNIGDALVTGVDARDALAGSYEPGPK